MNERCNIYAKFKYVNIHKNSGWLKYLSGIRKCFELHLGETEEETTLYMTSTLLDERGMARHRRHIEAVMHDGKKYNILTQNIPGKTFWKDTSSHTGSITHNEIEIAKIEFYRSIRFENWQINLFLNSGEKIRLVPFEEKKSCWGTKLIYTKKKKIRIIKDEILLMEIDDLEKRPTKIGSIKTSEIQPELLFVFPLYYYVLYPDYIEDRTVTS